MRQCLQCDKAMPTSHWPAHFCGDCNYLRFNHNGRAAAGREVANAIRKGLLPSPKDLPCTDCGGVAKEYDHRDYNKPLDVQPVCVRCNRLRGPGIWVRFKTLRQLLAEKNHGTNPIFLPAASHSVPFRESRKPTP